MSVLSGRNLAWTGLVASTAIVVVFALIELAFFAGPDRHEESNEHAMVPLPVRVHGREPPDSDVQAFQRRMWIGGTPDPEPSEVSEPLLEPDPDVARARVEAEYAGLLEAHAREVTDPAWSAEFENAIAEDLAKMIGSGANFAIDKVDCRSSSCVASVAWESQELAMTRYQKIVHSMAIPCAKMVLLPDDASEGAYKHNVLYFRCRDSIKTASSHQ